MSQVTSDIQIAAGDLSLNTASALHNLGERAVTPDGRSFRYCQAGASALVPGKLQQASAEVANHQNVTVATTAIAATSITVTLGNTAATANQYAGGWILISAGTGLGYQYKISSHPAAAGNATLVLTLEDPILVATLVSDSKADLIANPFKGVILNPASASSAPVGSGIFAITALYFGWIQVGGVANILNDGGSTVGTNVSASNATAGAVEAAVTAQAAVGIALTGITTAEYGAILLNLR